MSQLELMQLYCLYFILQMQNVANNTNLLLCWGNFFKGRFHSFENSVYVSMCEM